MKLSQLALWMIGIPWCIFGLVAIVLLKGGNPLVRRICIGALATGVLMMVSGVALLVVTAGH